LKNLNLKLFFANYCAEFVSLVGSKTAEVQRKGASLMAAFVFQELHDAGCFYLSWAEMENEIYGKNRKSTCSMCTAAVIQATKINDAFMNNID
jgi:hypothetical protein